MAPPRLLRRYGDRGSIAGWVHVPSPLSGCAYGIVGIGRVLPTKPTLCRPLTDIRHGARNYLSMQFLPWLRYGTWISAFEVEIPS
jgi:hypothetical protein